VTTPTAQPEAVVPGTMLTPAVLRRHAKADRTMAWEGQARQLLAWSADLVEAAEDMAKESKR
jgi:hypothetical protein